MNIEEIQKYFRCFYIKDCDYCGLTQEILTQSDEKPEYWTEIYLNCQCGNYIKFELPVN